MRINDFTKDNIAYHDQLNSHLWENNTLKLSVRVKLLEIAKRFIDYLEVPDFKLVDIVLRGSLVNYNYTTYSDVDVHIVTDYSTIKCENLAEEFYRAKKKIWNDQHDILIYGHEVELYVENIGEPNASEGLYSILNNQWVDKPTHTKPDINSRAVNAKVNGLIDIINRSLKGEVEDIQRVRNKLVTMRRAGLAKGGEYSIENLAFKILRNQGYLDSLAKIELHKQDQELSLDEGVKSNAIIAALVAALSMPAKADFNYPNTQPEVSPAAQALGIFRKINKMKNYGAAGLHGEATQEFNNIMRTIQGHPNQSKLYPLIKYIIKSPNTNIETQLLPLQEPEQPVNERKKAKKKKSKAKRLKYLPGGYWGWGYPYSGNDTGNSDGGGGDGGGE